MNLANLPFFRQLQTVTALRKYAKNLRRLFWCSIAIFVSMFASGVTFLLAAMEIIGTQSPLLVVSVLALFGSIAAYMWVKADCLDFGLDLKITRALNAACLCDMGAVIFRYGGGWIGLKEPGRSLGSILATIGLLLFIWFLSGLAKFTNNEALVYKARNTLVAYLWVLL
ncbi:MAG: hypothetical protein U0930_17475 [Pirellulales bacterium]